MKIQRYEVKDMQEALLKVKSELGNEAMIISSRKVKPKGLFGFMKQPLIEVIAAVEEKKTKRMDNPQEDFLMNLKQSQHISVLEDKLSKMENVLSKVYGELQESKFQDTEAQRQEFTNIIKLFYKHLIENDVEPTVAKELLSEINQEAQAGQSNVNYIVSKVCKKIVGQLGVVSPIQLTETSSPTVVMLVGTTGVGKTTTIAKLTADMILHHKKNVGLITCDTYRIAAVEQLKTYGEILGVPVEVVYELEDIPTAMDKFKEKDIIFIDTAGRSHKNSPQMEELQGLIDGFQPDEIFLVLSLAMKYKDISKIIEKYDFLPNYKYIFTKADETDSYGAILNACKLYNHPLSYITTGQNVPDDLEVVDKDNIAKKLLGRFQS